MGQKESMPMKPVGIHKSEDGTCDYVFEIINVDKKEYDRLLKEQSKKRQLEKEIENANLEAFAYFKNEISNLKHEIAILKGEEE